MYHKELSVGMAVKRGFGGPTMTVAKICKPYTYAADSSCDVVCLYVENDVLKTATFCSSHLTKA